MSSKIVIREIYTCDFCGKTTTIRTEHTDVGGPLPGGWSELTLRLWDDDATRGNEQQFANACRKCSNGFIKNFHEAGAFASEEDYESESD